MTADELAAQIGHEAAIEMASALGRIRHCLGQLTDDQTWQRSSPKLNSIGNLILHLCGNVRQWIVAGLSGGADTRDRPAEFAERGPIGKDELLRRIDGVVREATTMLQRQTAEQLVRVRRIQGFEITCLAALFNSVPHFRGHTQEIIHMTRQLLGDGYKFAWAPASAEEGL